MTRCWVCNEEFGVDGVHICANTPFKIKPTMTKVTIDRALIEQAISELLPEQLGVSHFALRQKLRAALAEPAVEPYAWAVTGAGLFSIGPERPFDDDVWQPVYTSPPPPAEPAPVPLLSDEEVGMMTVYGGLHHVDVPLLAEFVRHIETAVRRKAGLK